VREREGNMEWWIVAALVVVLLLMIRLYRISLRETRALTNYTLLILLDEKVLAAQRESLREFVRASEAKNAGELGGKVYLATGQLAEKLSHTVLGTNGLLWELKKGGAARSG
jgi:hypothetical protein